MKTSVRRRLMRLLAVTVVVCLLCDTIATAQKASTAIVEPAPNYSGSLSNERDRGAERTLRRAQTELAAGDISDAVRRLQRVLDADADSFVLTDGVYRSAWDVADIWLSELPPAGRETYERLFGPPAQEELALAMRSGIEENVRRIVRRYRLTAAGQQACVYLAVLAMDRGESAVAAGWSRLIDTDSNVVSRLGLGDRLLKDVDRQIADFSDSLPVTDQANAAIVDESVWSPDISWKAEILLTGQAEQEISDSLSELDAQAIVPLTSAKPLLHDGQIVTRQLGRLIAVDQATGELIWQREIDSPVGRMMKETGSLQNSLRRRMAMAYFLERLVRSSLLDHLTTDGTRLFAIIADSKLDPSANIVVPKNMLAALSLGDGRLLWRAGADVGLNNSERDARTSIDSDPELSKVFFLGTPVPVGRWRLVLGQRESTVFLLAVDAESGRLEWSVPLGQTVRTLAEDKPRQGTSCRVLIHNRRVYCPTAAGTLACVDLLSRRLLWSVRYPRDDLPNPVNTGQPPRDSRDLTRHLRMPTRDIWHEMFLNVVGDHVLLASPDADQLFAFDAIDGRVLWQRPRGRGLLVAGPVDERLIVIGRNEATAVAIADGRELWSVEIERPAGSGFFAGSQYVFPTRSGSIQGLELNDGRRTELRGGTLGNHVALINGSRIPVSLGPSRRLRHVEPRNLVQSEGAVLAQSFGELAVVTQPPGSRPNEPVRQRPASEEQTDSSDRNDGLWSAVLQDADLMASVERACHLSAYVRREMGAVEAAVHLARRFLPLLKAPDERAAELISELAISLQNEDRSRARSTLQRLLRQPVGELFVTLERPGHSVRLDHWLSRGFGEAVASDAQSQAKLSSTMASLLEDFGLPQWSADDADNTSTTAHAGAADRQRLEKLYGTRRWGSGEPRITEEESLTGQLYVNTVPLTVTADSPWEWVTVQMDRTGRDLFFHRTDLAAPVIVRLPRSPGSPRMIDEFLHAWANGPLLVLRVGTDLFGFQLAEADGSLPQAPLWPLRGESRSLAGERPPLISGLQESSPDPRPLWDDSLPGFFDPFGRQFAEVGPVCATCVCFWDRGHLVALDPMTGEEIWSRSDYPVGTHCVGDDDRLVMLRNDTTEVEVIRSIDGMSVGSWNWRDLQKNDQQPETVMSQIIAVRDTLALCHSDQKNQNTRSRPASEFEHPDDDVTVSVINLATGQRLWSRTVLPDVWVVRLDARLVVLVDPAGTLMLLDWQTGTVIAEHNVTLPRQITSLDVITHAEQAFVVVSERPDDNRIIGAQQIHNANRRPIVKGWIHALARHNGRHLWESRLENVGLPLDQPRHVPLLVANYVLLQPGSRVPAGVLHCLDRRTGELVYKHRRRGHVYHSFRADAAQQRVELQLRKQVVHFDYRTE